jgi:Na+-driven multidrug efflux pump
VFFLDGGAQITGAQVSNGIATSTINFLSVGTHIITAQYTGDTNNQASTTQGSLNQVITGTTLINISGTTSTITHWTQINVVIQ